MSKKFLLLATILGLILALTPNLSYSEGLSKPKGKVTGQYPQHPAAQDWVEKQRAELNTMVGGAFAGAFGQYNWTDEETPWLAGAFAGYILRNQTWGFGAEVDATRRFENLPCSYGTCPEEIDNWMFTARGFAGMFVGQGLFAYGTAGLAWEGEARNDFVWGGGVKLTTTERTFVKAEVLKIERDDEPLLFRVGLGFTF